MEPEELIPEETVASDTEPAGLVTDQTDPEPSEAELVDSEPVDEDVDEEHEAAAEEFTDESPDEDEHSDAEDQTEKRPTIFISYNRNENDHAVAERIYAELSPDCDVFLDTTRNMAEVFPEVAQDWLNRADFVIALISPAFLRSHWVAAELEHAFERAKKDGRPSVLPIRINYEGPLTLALRAYIGRFNALYWDNRNYNALFEKLHAAIEA